MRGFENHRGYDVRLIFDQASGEFLWQRLPQQPPVPSTAAHAKPNGE